MKLALRSLEDRAIEWFLSLVLIWWGFNLALDGDMLAGSRFRGFQQLGLPEDVWAALLMGVGAMRLVALYVNGRRPSTPYYRVAGATVGFLVWAWIAQGLSTGLTNTPLNWYEIQIAQTRLGPGWGVYQLAAFFELFSIYRAMKDSRYLPQSHRRVLQDDV